MMWFIIIFIMTEKTGKALSVLSGGLDSAVCLGIAAQQFEEVSAMFFSYGQKTHDKEKECAEALVKHYDVKDYINIDLSWLKLFGVSALFDSMVALDEENQNAEYVPFRNSIFLSIATAYAESKKLDAVIIGSTGGDHICPDNSPDFIESFQRVMAEGTLIKKDIKLLAPLLKGDKEMAIKIAKELDIPLELTWSCHNNTELACGKCSNCRARLEAFEALGLVDPIPYEKNL